MKFYQLNYQFADMVNHTKYYRSYDKARAYFDKLIKTASSETEITNYEHDNNKGIICDWTWGTIDDHSVLDVSIMVKETEDD